MFQFKMHSHMPVQGFMGKCWKWCHKKGIGLVVLRVALGAFFLAHGVSKFQNMAIMKQFFGSLGLWTWLAPFVATVESVSGVALILGAFLWPVAVALTIDMAVAIWKVNGVNLSGAPLLVNYIAGWGPNVIYAAAAVALAFVGPGRYSLAAVLMRKYHQKGWCRECSAGSGMTCDSCGSGRCGECARCKDGICQSCQCDRCEPVKIGTAGNDMPASLQD